MFSPCNSKFTLAEAVAADVGVEVVEAVAHVPAVADSRHQRLTPARPRPDQLPPVRPVPARPLGQVLAAPRLVPVPQVALLPERLPKVAVLQERLRKVALPAGKLPKVALLAERLPQAAACQVKVLPLDSVRAEQVRMSLAAVRRPAR